MYTCKFIKTSLTPLFCFYLFCFCTIQPPSLFSREQQHLKESDVPQVMQEIFDQHLEQKEMTSTLLQHSFRTYINQFDPDRIYLLDSEVEPLTQPGALELRQDLMQYYRSDLSAYKQINDAIQNAIVRARKLRAELEQGDTIFTAKKRGSFSSPTGNGTHKPFAKSIEELRQRIQEQMIRFVQIQEQHFGAALVAKKHPQVVRLYEKEARQHENRYLFENNQGLPIAEKDRTHIFVTHVLQSIAGSLDAHSRFFNTDEASDMKLRLEKSFSGTGIVLEEGLEGVIVTKIIQGSPAAKSGLIKLHDQVVEINEQPLSNLSYHDILEVMRGSEGTPVKLLLKRMDAADPSKYQWITVNLVRAPIQLHEDRVDVSTAQTKKGIIGKIVLHSFYQGENGISSEQDVLQAIKRLEAQGNLEGLILDLRNNSGGYLMQAVKVAGLFIRSGVIVISKYANGEEKIYRDIKGKATYTGPLVILTSRATASAAEIVAESLQDYGVAIIVGDDRTYGKGSIQSQTVTDGQSSNYFKVTVGKYYTVSGESPQVKGVQADVVVPGPYMRQQIGEMYLNPSFTADTIPAEFNDNLKDIDVQKRAWYAKYYVPTLQQRVYTWTNMIPILKQRSAERLRKPLYSADIQMEEAVRIIQDMVMLRACEGVNCSGSYARPVARH